MIIGATGVGKSDLSIDLAKWLSAPIISSDSRQIYKQMRIGTAVPSQEQLDAVTHYFIQTHDATQLYTAGDYARDVIALLEQLFIEHDNVMLVGGSGLYIDAVCNGIDDIPAVDGSIREHLNARVENGELPLMLEELKEKDCAYYDVVDRENAKRVIRALEVITATGRPFSSFRTGDGKKRNFNIVKIGVMRPREELYERINHRVDLMMKEGLLAEAQSLYPLRDCNALQTVGYREFFDYMDGKTTLDEAIELLKRNSRRYAKRQATWFRKDRDTAWFSPDDQESIMKYITARMKENDFLASCCRDKTEVDLLDIMTQLQLRYEYISNNAIDKLSSYLAVEKKRIENIVKYNDDFSPQVAKYPISICLGKLCSKHGGEELLAQIENSLGVHLGEITPDGRFSLTKRNCIGNCSTAPTLWVGDTKYDNIKSEELKEILNGLSL